LQLIDNRGAVLSASVQAKVTRLLDERSRCSATLERPELSALVALAWSFQYGMRPIQQVAVRPSNIRLYTDAKGERQAHLVFHKVKQRRALVEPLVRQMKPEWVPLLDALMQRNRDASMHDAPVLRYANAGYLTNRLKSYLRAQKLPTSITPYTFRHNAAQMLADGGKPRELIQEFLGHSSKATAKAYIDASNNQAEVLNAALGVSKLYQNIESIASGRFASIVEIESAHEDKQIAGFAGSRPIAGLGLCSSGQPSCPYNPITSCYGCDRFIPSSNTGVHEQAIAGMREQVLLFEKSSRGEADSPAYAQLTRPIAVAQQTLQALTGITV
jgi:hypothetical protein